MLKDQKIIQEVVISQRNLVTPRFAKLYRLFKSIRKQLMNQEESPAVERGFKAALDNQMKVIRDQTLEYFAVLAPVNFILIYKWISIKWKYFFNIIEAKWRFRPWKSDKAYSFMWPRPLNRRIGFSRPWSQHSIIFPLYFYIKRPLFVYDKNFIWFYRMDKTQTVKTS